MWISPEHEKLQYTGRIDWKDKEAPVFFFPGTSVRMRFTGETIKVRVRNQSAYWDSYLGIFPGWRAGKAAAARRRRRNPGDPGRRWKEQRPFRS